MQPGNRSSGDDGRSLTVATGGLEPACECGAGAAGGSRKRSRLDSHALCHGRQNRAGSFRRRSRIAPSIASRVFDPFFTTKPAGVGTGLGLSIVYGIVQQHGGDVTLESHRGSGAKFVIELPMASSLAEQATVPPPEIEGKTVQVRVAEFSWWKMKRRWRN